MSNTIGGKPPTATTGKPVLGGDLGRINESSGKATPSGPTFGSVMASARPILKGAEAAASVLPGGPLLAAAVKAPSTIAGAGGAGAYGAYGGAPGGTAMTPRIVPGPGGMTAAPGMAVPSVSGAVVPSVGVPGGAGEPGAVTGSGAEANGMESMLADSQAFNLYYLQLQEQISAENRSYSTMSNVLKARHDTVKNAIGNIR